MRESRISVLHWWRCPSRVYGRIDGQERALFRCRRRRWHHGKHYRDLSGARDTWAQGQLDAKKALRASSFWFWTGFPVVLIAAFVMPVVSWLIGLGFGWQISLSAAMAAAGLAMMWVSHKELVAGNIPR